MNLRLVRNENNIKTYNPDEFAIFDDTEIPNSKLTE